MAFEAGGGFTASTGNGDPYITKGHETLTKCGVNHEALKYDDLRRNFPQREIADASFRYQQEVDSKQRIVVGVNDYVAESEEATPILRIDPEMERKQKGRLEATKARRDSAEVERRLDELKGAAATDANLMPPILDCARARVSEGEMVVALQQVFGSYTELPVF